MTRAASPAAVRGSARIETRGLNPETRAGILFSPCAELGPGFAESVSPRRSRARLEKTASFSSPGLS